MTYKNITDESISDSNDNENAKTDEEDTETKEDILNSDNTEPVKDLTNEITVASLLSDCKVDVENDKLRPSDVPVVISHLFLTRMPDDFYQFYEFCKSVCKEDPLSALKDLQLYLVGPYDVFGNKFLSSKVSDKEALLRHWRYYYDPPEFQVRKLCILLL